jgi:PST family polysaccharide transporter
VASVAEGAARGAAWNVATTLVTRGAGLVGTLLLTRFISPAEFGEVSAAWVCVLTVTMFTHLRFGQYVIAKAAPPEEAYQANIVHFGLGVLGLGFIYAVRNDLGQFFDAPTMAKYVPGFAITALIERVAYIPERTLVRDLQFRPLSIARSTGELAYTGVSLATAPFVGGMAIVIGSLVRAILVTTMTIRASKWKEWGPRAPIEWATLKQMFDYCAPLAVGGIAEFASAKWDNLLVSRYFGPRQLGMYNLAYNLADTPTGAVGEQVGDVLFPSFSKLEAERREPALLRATRLMALIVFPLAIGLASVAPTVVRVFFDARWVEVAPMLGILSVLSIARPVAWPLLSFMQAQHRQRAIMILSLGKVALLIVAIVVFARWGPLWTCVGVGATFLIHAFCSLLCVRLLDNVKMMRVVMGILPVLVACAAMGGGVTAVRLGLKSVGVGASWLSLILEIGVGAALYIFTAFVVARPLAMDLIDQVKKVIKRKREKGADASE